MPRRTLPCPRCETFSSREVLADVQTSAGHRKLVLRDIARMKCNNCGEEFYTSEQLDQLRRAAIARRRSLDPAIPSPEAIRAFRARLKLSQAELEQLLGLGPKVIVYYETGKRVPNPSISRLITLAMSLKGAVDKLRAVRMRRRREDEEAAA